MWVSVFLIRSTIGVEINVTPARAHWYAWLPTKGAHCGWSETAPSAEKRGEVKTVAKYTKQFNEKKSIAALETARKCATITSRDLLTARSVFFCVG